MQNFPLALFVEETSDTPYPSQKPMDVASIVGSHATLDSSGSFEATLLGVLLLKW